MSKEGQLKAIGIVAIVWGSLLAFIFFILFIFIIGMIGIDMEGASTGEGIFWTLILISAAAYIILHIIAGIGILKHKNWARIILIILAILNIPNVPIGTGLGTWFLIVLFDKKTKALME
jgi:hypothetical protein